MANSQNGWSVISSSQLDKSAFPGTSVVPLPGIRQGDVATVLHWVGQQFNNRVEALVNPGCWGYANRPIIGGSQTSNHASGTAIDLNAPKHPLGKANTFTQAQKDAIHAIINETGGVVRWGGDYSGRKDEMHFEIVGNTQQVAELANRLRGGSNPVPQPPSTGSETLKAGTWNLRRSPNGAIIGVVPGRTTLQILGNEGGWRKVNYAGKTGYIGPAAWSSVAPGPAPAPKRSIQIKPGTWNARTGPGMNHGIRREGPVLGGQRYGIEAESNGWVKINFVNKPAWVGPAVYRKI